MFNILVVEDNADMRNYFALYYLTADTTVFQPGTVWKRSISWIKSILI